jgi:uncharacterized protein YaiE (UPF0345 family)
MTAGRRKFENVSVVPMASFDVPGDSSFEIAVDAGIAEYVCSFG